MRGAALTAVTDATAMLSELRKMQEQRKPEIDENDPEMRREMERANRELAEMDAQYEADREYERRTGKPVRRDWRGQRIDDDSVSPK